MRKILYSFAIFFCLFLTSTTVTHAAVIWNEVQPAGDTDKYWVTAKVSGDGRVIVVGGHSGGRLYISRDYGANWVEVQPDGDNDDSWLTLGMSSDGKNILAGVYGGRLYLSTDEGYTWTDTMPAGDVSNNWYGGAVSGDGQTMMAGYNSGRVYLSKNGGTTWAETQPAGDVDNAWIPMAANGNGKVLLAGVYNGRLYRSTNSGTSWSEIQPGGNLDLNWNALSISKDGQTMLAGVDDATSDPPLGVMYISQDGGNTWRSNMPDGITAQEWRIASMSDDGKIMMLGYGDGSLGRLYVSQNSGSTWDESRPRGDTENFWSAGGISGDGYTFAAGIGYVSGTRRIYVGTLPKPVAATTSVAAPTPGCQVSAPEGKPNLFQVDTSDTKAKLYFSPVSANTNKYFISVGYSPDKMNFGAELLGNSTGVMSYTVNYLSPNTTYYVRVRAANDCTIGDWSNEMKIKTAAKGSTSGIEYYKDFPTRFIAFIEHIIHF